MTGSSPEYDNSRTRANKAPEYIFGGVNHGFETLGAQEATEGLGVISARQAFGDKYPKNVASGRNCIPYNFEI